MWCIRMKFASTQMQFNAHVASNPIPSQFPLHKIQKDYANLLEVFDNISFLPFLSLQSFASVFRYKKSIIEM
jgi:hypothetical protein